MDYNFSITLTTKRNSPVLIDPDALYGYWERLNGSEGGGLWFSKTDAGLELVDSDGSSQLRADIVDALRTAGYVVGEEWNVD